MEGDEPLRHHRAGAMTSASDGARSTPPSPVGLARVPRRTRRSRRPRNARSSPQAGREGPRIGRKIAGGGPVSGCATSASRAVSEPGAAGRARLHAAGLRGDFPPPALPGSGYGGRLVSLSAFGSCPPPWYLRRGLRFPAPPLVPQVSFMICDGAASSQGTKVTGARAVGPLGRRFAAAWYRS